MFTKCQLLHLEKLKPKTVEESTLLLSTLELSVVFFVLKSINNNSYSLSDIYCNRKRITEQRDLLPDNNKCINEPEMFSVNQLIQKFVGDLLDSYNIVRLSNPTHQLNIEISLLTRHNVAISYDLF